MFITVIGKMSLTWDAAVLYVKYKNCRKLSFMLFKFYNVGFGKREEQMVVASSFQGIILQMGQLHILLLWNCTYADKFHLSITKPAYTVVVESYTKYPAHSSATYRTVFLHVQSVGNILVNSDGKLFSSRSA